MQINIGSNLHFGVPFPLVLADRFFAIQDRGGRMVVDVFRWDETTQTAHYEVQESVPLAEHIRTNPTGIVTVTNEVGGDFLYKFRPKPGVSQIFGRVPVVDDIEVRVKDHEMSVTRAGTPIVTMQRNMIAGCPIGVLVGADGSVAMGVNWLPDGMTLAA